MDDRSDLHVIEIVAEIEAEASGPSYSVPRLCRALAGRGVDVRLLSIGGPLSHAETPTLRDIRHLRDFAGYPIARTLLLSGAMKRALYADAKRADIVHSHGLWLMPNIYPGWAARASGKPHVVSPRGTLSAVALKRSRLKKSLFWFLVQGREVRAAACLHATSEQEYRDIRAAGFRQPVAVIPNGIDIPDDEAREQRAEGLRNLLYLGRMHPIKGLENLLQAWKQVATAHADWQLTLCGPDERNYQKTLQELAQSLGLERVRFLEPAYGADKQRTYRAADLFVLPSFSENFGMSVAEALAHGVPVVTTTATPWTGLADHQAGWCIETGAAPLAAALTQAMARSPAALRQMGETGRAWMQADYAWEPIAQKMKALYVWLARGGPVPETVRLN